MKRIIDYLNGSKIKKNINYKIECSSTQITQIVFKRFMNWETEGEKVEKLLLKNIGRVFYIL